MNEVRVGAVAALTGGVDDDAVRDVPPMSTPIR
jgi:hypothetical protein